MMTKILSTNNKTEKPFLKTAKMIGFPVSLNMNYSKLRVPSLLPLPFLPQNNTL